MHHTYPAASRGTICALLLALLVLPACDSGADDDGENPGPGGIVGAAEVTVSGAVTGTFSGSATFFVNGEGFVLNLIDGPPTAASEEEYKAISFLGNTDGRPSGTLALGGDGVYTLYSEVEDDDVTVTAAAADGEVTFTTSTADRLAGSFEMTGTARDAAFEEIGTVTIQGTFDARAVGVPGS